MRKFFETPAFIRTNSEMNFLMIILSIIGVYSFSSCQDANFDYISYHNAITEQKTSKRAVVPDSFDWENIDWMPTPRSQRIPSPWIGQGSLASTYDLEIVNDRKKSDGWVLVYNSFTNKTEAPLINPYFVLYNKYRGLLRVYVYTTTQFLATSTYIQDCISISSNNSTSMLNFVGNYLVDATKTKNTYRQIQPASIDGSAPLATNKWYMLQYEMAYDKNISSLDYDKIQLVWNLNYCNVDAIMLGGNIHGTIDGVIGESQNSNKSWLSSLSSASGHLGKGVLGGVTQRILNKYKTDNNGGNTLGISNALFSSIYKGVLNVATSGTSGFLNELGNIVSAIFGGTKSTSIPVNLNLECDVELSGTQKSSGSFPAMPISFWMPGTSIASNASGYIPLYNKSLGIINFDGKPKLETKSESVTKWVEDHYFIPAILVRETYYTTFMPDTIDYSEYLTINPELKKTAKVEVVKQDLIAKDNETGHIEVNPKKFHALDTDRYSQAGTFSYDYPDVSFYDRFCIKITPNDGSSVSYIIKSFLLDCEL